MRSFLVIEQRGAGICLPLRSLGKPVFRATLERVLDTSFKTNMRRLKSFQDRCDGPEGVAIALQELARSQGKVPQ